MNLSKKIVNAGVQNESPVVASDLEAAFRIITNPAAQKLIGQTAALCKPARVRVYTGTEAEKAALYQDLVDAGVFTKLTDPRFTNCYSVRTDETDVARAEKRTFSCTRTPEAAGVGNNYWNAADAEKELLEKFDGVMAGRTMWVIPMRMGPKGSPYSEVGIQICDSEYAVANLSIMNQVNQSVVDEINLGAKGFISGLASVGAPLAPGEKSAVWPCIKDPNQRYFCTFPDTPVRIKHASDVRALPPVVSLGSGYGGNMILSKKFFALRLAALLGEKEDWIPTHMTILKVTLASGEIKYVAGAFPSACGKTNLAMLRVLKDRYGDAKVETIGDDIAWIHPEADGWRAVNPESGFFGVAPGTSEITNPNAFDMVHRNTLFTNVATTREGGVWWRDYSKVAPEGMTNWRGKPAGPGDEKTAAHPNSRFTTPATECQVLAPEFHDPNGVKLDLILFGGRRDDTVPLCLIAEDWEQAMFYGATMGSNATAAADQVGTERDPFANRPFQPKDPSDYAHHFYKLGIKYQTGRPAVALVNWFLREHVAGEATGDFIWEGFSANFAVIDAIFRHLQDDTLGTPTMMGRQLSPDAIAIGDSCKPEHVHQLLNVDSKLWRKELESAADFLKAKMRGPITEVLMSKIEEMKAGLAV